MNTVLITGCSAGYDLETARLFLDRGWRVVATMRTPREDLQAIEAAGPLSLALELATFGVQATLVEPGHCPDMSPVPNSRSRCSPDSPRRPRP